MQESTQLVAIKNQSPSHPNTGYPFLTPESIANKISAGNTGDIQQSPDKVDILNIGSSLLAGTFGGAMPEDLGAAEFAMGAAAAILNLLYGRTQDVGRALNDENAKARLIAPGTQGAQGGDETLNRGSTTDTAEAKPETAAERRAHPGNYWCPSVLFGTRNVAWCDTGLPQSIEVVEGSEEPYGEDLSSLYIRIYGYICTSVSHPSFPPPFSWLSSFLLIYKC